MKWITKRETITWGAKQLLTLAMSLLLITGIGFTACEGPAGPQGKQGPQGPQGPRGKVGPAGEDGSVIYAGKGAPSKDIGKIGDYYLNTKNGKYYGPKDKKGWDKPIIVLMGPQGPRSPRGREGPEGPAGEDGSQIFAGNGSPKAKLGKVGDYYLDKNNYNLYGPKTNKGWGTPIHLKGADGNANVTKYVFTSGYNFRANDRFFGVIATDGRDGLINSAWLTYLVNEDHNVLYYFQIPGMAAANSIYSVNYYNSYNSDPVRQNIYLNISKESGVGTEYDQIIVVRIRATGTVQHSIRGGSTTIIPEGLNVSDYEAVADYYGFGNAN